MTDKISDAAPSHLTRPIIGIENRSAQEVFDIMCDRFSAYRTASNPLREVLDKFPGVKVKPLKWKEPHASTSYPTWRAANGDIGFEAVIDTSGPAEQGKFPLFINGVRVKEVFEELGPAMAAAQADYERRSLSALKTTPAPVSEMDGPAVSMIAPPCRVCRETKWVAIWSEEKPKETICIDCCHSGEHEHANGETGHEFDRGTSLSVSSCIHCGMERP